MLRPAGHGNRHRTLLLSLVLSSTFLTVLLRGRSNSTPGVGGWEGDFRERGTQLSLTPCLPAVFSFCRHGLVRSRLKGHLCTREKVSTRGGGQLGLQEQQQAHVASSAHLPCHPPGSSGFRPLSRLNSAVVASRCCFSGPGARPHKRRTGRKGQSPPLQSLPVLRR